MNSNITYKVAPKDDLVPLDWEAIKKGAKKDMLYSVYKDEPKDDFDKSLNERIKVAYKNLCGEDIQNYPTVLYDKIKSYIYIYGDNTADKSEDLKTAAKEVAAEIGLNYVEEFPKGLNWRESTAAQKQEHNDKVRSCFLFLDIDLMVPPKKSFDVLGKVTALGYVGAGFLHFKNFSGAPSNVQDVAIRLTEPPRPTIRDSRQAIKVPVFLGGNFYNPDEPNYMNPQALSGKILRNGSSKKALLCGEKYVDPDKNPNGYIAVPADLNQDFQNPIFRLRAIYAKDDSVPSVKKTGKPGIL